MMIKSPFDKLSRIYNSTIFTNHGRVFLIVLLLKLGITFFVVPELYTYWFIPFVKNFVSSGYQNPWNAFLDSGGHNKAFPYGTGMLLISTLPFSLKSLITNISPDVITTVDIFLFRIPILFADIGILYLLVYTLKLGARKSIYIYWCSPIVYYITYIFGQLDVIPMFILFMATLLLISSKRLVYSALFLAFGLVVKENLIVAIPLLLFYILRTHRSWIKAAFFFTVIIAAYSVMISPVFFSSGYQAMVLNAEERSWVYLSVIPFGDFNVLLVPLAIGFLYLKFSLYSKLNNDILIMYLGLTFTILLLLVPSNAPGWYMWVVPFLCYYYINNANRFHYTTLVLFSILFIVFFLIQVPYPQNLINPDVKSVMLTFFGNVISESQISKITDIIFTFLQGIIAYIAVAMYVHGVRSNEVYQERKSPLTIGVGGNSGAGKDTLCNSLKMLLGSKSVIQIDGDDAHRWERGHQMWKVYSHLNPKANDLFLQFDHTHSLRKGKSIIHRFYSHDSGKFSNPTKVESSKYIFVCGLHPFYLRNMRDLIDVKIYLDTEDQLRTYWKIKRDSVERGYSKEQVIESIKIRGEDKIKYIEPQKEIADVIIRYKTIDELKYDEINDNSPLEVVFYIDNSIDLGSLIYELEEVPDIKITHSYEQFDKQMFSFKGKISSEKLHEISLNIIPNFYELVDVRLTLENDLKGITQVVILCVISYIKSYGLRSL